MTPLQAADHYVRHAECNRELMELGEGQIIEVSTYLLGVDKTNIIPENNKSQCQIVLYDGGGSSFNGEDTEYYGETMGVYVTDWALFLVWGEYGKDGDGDIPPLEILGRPPQLQHYLRVLVANNRTWAMTKDAKVVVVEAKEPEIQFSLTTGAPATNEDASKFLELCGVEVSS